MLLMAFSLFHNMDVSIPRLRNALLSLLNLMEVSLRVDEDQWQTL